MNSYTINYKETIFLLLLGISCPILSIPFILISIYKKNVYSIFILAFICSLLIGIMPPYADTYHYYLHYKRTTSFVFNLFETSRDFLFYLFAYISNSLNIQYMYFRSFLVIMEMLIFSWIFYDYTKNHNIYLQNKQLFFLFVIILFLSIDFMFIGFMIRYALMGTFLILSIYLFYKSKKLLSIFFLFLSVASHFAALLFLPCFLFAIIFNNKFLRITKIIMCIVALVLGVTIFLYFYSLLPQIFQKESYVSGSWSGFEYKSFNGMLYYIFQYYILSGITIFLYMLQKHENNFLERVTFFILLMFCCICSFSELSQRVWWVLKILISFSLITSIIKHKDSFRLSKLYILIGLLVLSQAMVFYGLREFIFVFDNLKHLFSPVTFLISDNYDDYYFFTRSFYINK